MTGTVYKSTGSWYTVKTENGKSFECRIKGKFRLKGIKSTNPIAVGDHVDFELETKNDEVTGVINKIHDRTNYIIRKSVNLAKQTHIIASNIDQVFLIVTIDNPPTFTSFIDRFLASAEAYSIKTILLFKITFKVTCTRVRRNRNTNRIDFTSRLARANRQRCCNPGKTQPIGCAHAVLKTAGETSQTTPALLRFILQPLHPSIPDRYRTGFHQQPCTGMLTKLAHGLQTQLVFIVRLNVGIVKKRGNAV